ncbi:UNVERIFIED_CONTAM: hypothetical protein HDU68_003084 [Siphonaria sp. JEL0065]|nr:hypothetical protein HDU68_003084 [Siphonaria sp. JEL0065]
MLSTIVVFAVSVIAQPAIITSGGSSFPLQPYTSAISAFNNLYYGVLADTYGATDSLTGQRSAMAGAVNWAGSDNAINPTISNNGTLVALPALAGAHIIAYNLPGIYTKVKFSRQVLPRIFDGTIVNWNDPQLLVENPFLANNTNRIRIIRKGPTSASTILLRGYFKGLDKSTGFKTSPSPFDNVNVFTNIPNTLVGANSIATSVLISAIANTITYMNHFEAAAAINAAGSTVRSALLQHLDGSFIDWSVNSSKIVVDSVQNQASNMNLANETISSIDLPAPGAYPLTIVSNFAINPNNISTSYVVTVATLKFLWMFVQTPSFVESSQYLSIFNTSLASRTLNYLKTITFNGQQIYGQSICDVDIDGTYANPCVHGKCMDPLPFQAASTQCICDFGYQNVLNQDCSEPTPLFIPATTTFVQLALFAIAVITLSWVSSSVYNKRNEPDVKAISPYCCYLILVGAFVGVCSILTHALSTNDSVCLFDAILPAVSFGMIFSMILFKSLRIFLIFGYSKVARSRLLKDDVMIVGSVIVGIIDGLLAATMIKDSKIQPLLAKFDDSPTSYWECMAPPEYSAAATRWFAGIVTYNGIIVILCIAMGFATRKASEKFDESKKVGPVIVLSTLVIVFDFAINFAFPQHSTSMFYVCRIIDSITVFAITVGSPLILFSTALGISQNKKTGMSHNNSDVTSSRQMDSQDGLVKTYMFHTGFKLNRSTSLWKSAVLMVMPDLDMLIVLSDGNNGTHVLSQSTIKVQEKTAKAAKERTEEIIELTLGTAKTCFLVEFPQKEKMEEFRGLRTLAGMKRAAGGSSHALPTKNDVGGESDGPRSQTHSRSVSRAGSQKSLATFAAGQSTLSRKNSIS